MFTQQMLRQLTDTDIQDYLEYHGKEFGLAGVRVERLQARRQRDPGWSFYDPRIGEEVGIEIRIEEWQAVRDEMKAYTELFIREQEHRQGYNQTIRMF